MLLFHHCRESKIKLHLEWIHTNSCHCCSVFVQKRRRGTVGVQLDDKRKEMLKRHPLSLCIDLKCKGVCTEQMSVIWKTAFVLCELHWSAWPWHLFCLLCCRWQRVASVFLLPDEPQHSYCESKSVGLLGPLGSHQRRVSYVLQAMKQKFYKMWFSWKTATAWTYCQV